MSARFVLCRDRRSFEAELAAAGGRCAPQDGFEPARAGLVCFGALESEGAERVALLAAAYGAGLIALVDRHEPSPGFLEDLSRLGGVVWREPAATSGIGAEERRMLELLAEGLSLAQAATRLHVSRRTADRRLRAARQALGADSTAEAIVRLRPDPSARVG